MSLKIMQAKSNCTVKKKKKRRYKVASYRFLKIQPVNMQIYIYRKKTMYNTFYFSILYFKKYHNRKNKIEYLK